MGVVCHNGGWLAEAGKTLNQIPVFTSRCHIEFEKFEVKSKAKIKELEVEIEKPGLTKA